MGVSSLSGVAEAERDALARISKAKQQAEEAEAESNRRLESGKDQYIKQTELESARQEGSLQAQQTKGYETIRELQRAQQAELNRLKREGEDDLRRAKNYYRDTISNTLSKGDQELDSARRDMGRTMEYLQKSSGNEIDANRDNSIKQINDMKTEQDQKYEALTDGSKKQYEKMKETAEQAAKLSREHFDKNYQSTLSEQERAIHDIETRASQSLKNLRADTSHKLAAYASRQKDPFYKLMNIDADIDEKSDSFILTARVPEHEQQHISVTVRGNELVVSGRRRNEEKLELSPGHKLSTASYQSFSESFQLSYPVDGKQVGHIFEGDQLIVRVPKKGMDTTYKRQAKANPERAVAERPDFPLNLPPPRRHKPERPLT